VAKEQNYLGHIVNKYYAAEPKLTKQLLVVKVPETRQDRVKQIVCFSLQRRDNNTPIVIILIDNNDGDILINI
jgi:hypothetical protein